MHKQILKIHRFPVVFITDSMGSDYEEEEDEDDPIKPPLNLGHLTVNGAESVGHLGASELSLQSMSTDSKNNDDSDQVCCVYSSGDYERRWN
jgi:hypothetical protein